MEYIIGLDVGTTGTKAIVADENGRILGSGYMEYELSNPRPGYIEQNAEDWWKGSVCAVRNAIKDICPANVKAIGLSTQGASSLAVDENFEPLCKAITWMDTRSEKGTEELVKKVGFEKMYRKSGWRPSATLDAPKIIWLRDEQPDVFRKARSFVSTLEYVNFMLTGENVADPTNAAIRQLMDINTGAWDKEILDAIGIDESKMPEMRKTGAVVGHLTKKAAEELGLPESVTVYNGAHDQYCASIGGGVSKVGDMMLATGTTWVTLGITEAALYTESYISPGIHPAGGFGAMASLVSAGSALKWWKNIIEGDFKQMDEEVEKRKESARTLLVYPYLAGAGFPHNAPEQKATIKGIEMRHDKYDIARALMEGVAFEAKEALGEFAKSGMPMKRLMMTGGAARSRVWSTMVGYVSGCEIWRTEQSENCCIGAAILAGVSSGIFGSFDDGAQKMVHPVKLELPDSEMYGYYKEKLALYRKNSPFA